MKTLLLNKLKKKSFYTCGFTEVTLTRVKKGIKVYITHGGNMGNDIKHSVNSNLEIMGFPIIEQLKMSGKKFTEKGWPDYLYEFKIII